MPTNVIMPALGVAQETGTLLKWLKSEGDAVSKGEPLMEIETDKATVEIEAPGSGILARVSAANGEEVPVGRTIALILAPGESLAHAPAPAQLESGETAPRPAAPPRPETPGAPPAPTPAAQGRRLLASPAARRIAREEGVDLAAVNGTGPQGSVLAADVRHARQRTTSKAQAGRTVPLSQMRRIVGRRMTESKQTAPHFYVGLDIDMTAVLERREAWNEKPEGRPSINDFILAACARALKEYPVLNAKFTDQGIDFFADIHIGMAVALEDGLVVPVIRNADRLSLTELAQQSRELAGRAQHKKLVPSDYEDGTFTVSNLGMLGVDNFIAIINPPQSAILAAGRVAPRVVADPIGISVRSMMTVTLSADHRVADGAVAARFLRRLKDLLEKAEL